MSRLRPSECQKEVIASRKSQLKAKPKREVDSIRATQNWRGMRERMCFFVIPMMEKMYLFRQAISRNQEWFPNSLVRDEQDQDGNKIKMMVSLLRNNRPQKKQTTLERGFEGTRILGEYVFGERLADSQSRLTPVCTFEDCHHQDVDIVHSGNSSQRKAFRCKACNGRWARYLCSDLTDLSYLKETPTGNHILRYGDKHFMKTYYEVAQDKGYCRWTRQAYLKNLRDNKPNTKMFTHFHTWLTMHQTMKEDFPVDTHHPCPPLTEEGWEIVGQELELFGSLEVPNPSGDEERSTDPEVAAPVPQTTEHFRMDVDQDNQRGSTSKASPESKKARAGRSSQATGSTRASQDDLAEAKNTQLPPDSDDERQGKRD